MLRVSIITIIILHTYCQKIKKDIIRTIPGQREKIVACSYLVVPSCINSLGMVSFLWGHFIFTLVHTSVLIKRATIQNTVTNDVLDHVHASSGRLKFDSKRKNRERKMRKS